MDRDQLIAIMSSLSSDNLLKALSAVGVNISGSIDDPMAGLGDPEMSDELTPWNQTEVKVPRTVRPPIVDTSRIMEDPQPVSPGGYLQSAPDSMAPYAATAGY